MSKKFSLAVVAATCVLASSTTEATWYPDTRPIKLPPSWGQHRSFDEEEGAYSEIGREIVKGVGVAVGTDLVKGGVNWLKNKLHEEEEEEGGYGAIAKEIGRDIVKGVGVAVGSDIVKGSIDWVKNRFHEEEEEEAFQLELQNVWVTLGKEILVGVATSAAADAIKNVFHEEDNDQGYYQSFESCVAWPTFKNQFQAQVMEELGPINLSAQRRAKFDHIAEQVAKGLGKKTLQLDVNDKSKRAVIVQMAKDAAKKVLSKLSQIKERLPTTTTTTRKNVVSEEGMNQPPEGWKWVWAGPAMRSFDEEEGYYPAPPGYDGLWAGAPMRSFDEQDEKPSRPRRHHHHQRQQRQPKTHTTTTTTTTTPNLRKLHQKIRQ